MIAKFNSKTTSGVGIQKHFVVVEIPGFELPNRSSGPSYVTFLQM